MKKIFMLCVLASVGTVIAQTKQIILTTSDNTTISIPLTDGDTASIDSATGNIFAITTATKDQFCNTDGDSSAVQGGTCSVSTEPLVAPSVSLTETDTSIPSGTTPIIKYTITGTATKCTKSGSWSGDITSQNLLIPGTTHSLSAPINISSPTDYGLTCFNTNALPSIPASITINILSIGGCPAPLNGQSNFTRDTSITNFNNNFPITASYPYAAIPYNPNFGGFEYVAWEFVAQANTHFKIDTEVSNTPPDSVSFAFSKCPGVFEETELNEFCHDEGSTTLTTIGVYTTDRTAASGICMLEVGETYYMNIIWANKNQTNSLYENGCNLPNCKMLQINNIFGPPN